METTQQLKSGDRVRVTQRIRQQDRWLSLTVEGEIVSCKPRPTGSWFAHGPDGRLWLDRLTVRKADGELSELVIDERTEIEVVQSPTSVMFEVYYMAPPDRSKEEEIERAIAPYGGEITCRENPSPADVSQAVCLTCEFGNRSSAEKAQSLLRGRGEHVENITDYG